MENLHFAVIFSLGNQSVSAQASLMLFSPMDSCPSENPWDFPGKNTGVDAIPFSRGAYRPRDQTHASCVSGTGKQVL